jgi:hypothetical protein
MKVYLNHFQDKKKLNRCASLIAKECLKRIRRSVEAKELRQKLKALPYVVRNGFMRMHMLKQDNFQLEQQARRIFSAKRK